MSSTTYKCYLNGVRVGLTVRIIDYEYYMLKVNFFVMSRPRVQVPSPAPKKQNNLDIIANCSVKSRVCEIFTTLFFNSFFVDIRPFYNRLELGNI